LEEKPKAKPGRKPKEILDESPSLLTDENESI
jgi:hypothetical protein